MWERVIGGAGSGRDLFVGGGGFMCVCDRKIGRGSKREKGSAVFVRMCLHVTG